jgi:hypothetical protein
MELKDYFDIWELVCPDVYKRLGERAWDLFNPRLLANLLILRVKINRAINANNWHDGGQFSQRGLRCNLCSLVHDPAVAGQLYISTHITGQAVDLDIDGMTAEEVRQWIIKNKTLFPYPLRLEKDVNWVHMDVMTEDNSTDKVTLF